MFDWFWNFLYNISRAIMKACDWLMEVALTLVGIDKMRIDGQDTDFITYLLRSNQVGNAMAALSLLAIIMVFLFTIIAIIRNIGKEEQQASNAQILMKSFKSLLHFLFIPLIMISLNYFLNIFMEAIYKATSQGSQSIGTFMFITFAGDNLSASEQQKFIDGSLNFYNKSDVWACMDLSDFNFIFSWIVGGYILYNIAGSLLIFVDRAISIVILFLAAPFSISASILDDGTHFKTWREQVLTKFLTGYGVIIAMNIYIMICGLVCNPKLDLFPGFVGVLNYVAKILICMGGAQTMRKSSALIASLMSSGGASDINDPVMTNFAQKAGGIVSALNPVGQVASAIGGAASRKFNNFKETMGNKALSALGFNMDFDRRRLGQEGGGGGGGSNSQNNNNAQYNDAEKNKQMKDALENDNGNKEKPPEGNDNDKKPEGNGEKGKELMNNALNNDKGKPKGENNQEEQ